MYSSIIWFIPTISTPCFAFFYFPWTSFVSPQTCALIQLSDTVTPSAVGIHEAKVMRKAISPQGNKTQAPHGWTWWMCIVSHPPDTAAWPGTGISGEKEQQLQ